MGFVDFAGSTVIHSVGGWAALAAILVIGPRTGRFDEEQPWKPSGSNLPLAMLGAMMLWMGWIGFNGGSTLAINDQIPVIIGNTFLAGSAGMLTALIVGLLILGHADVNQAINGSLAGLVAITAACHAVDGMDAVAIGVVGAVVMQVTQHNLMKYKIDDAIGAIPVHGAAGMWGTLAIAIFGDLATLGTGLSRWQQFQVQLSGIAVALVFTFSTTFCALQALRCLVRLRVTEQDEQVGLNIAEHGAATDVIDLLLEMERQRHSGDFSQKVSVEPGSDIGQIAAQYNRVIERVGIETTRAIQMAATANQARQKAEDTQNELLQTVAELREFNELAEGRELRMVELKTEVNNLLERSGIPERYNVSAAELPSVAADENSIETNITENL